jgi:hypothetical protein
VFSIGFLRRVIKCAFVEYYQIGVTRLVQAVITSCGEVVVPEIYIGKLMTNGQQRHKCAVKTQDLVYDKLYLLGKIASL